MLRTRQVGCFKPREQMGKGPEGGSPVSLKKQQSAGSDGTWRKRSLGKGAGEAEGK